MDQNSQWLKTFEQEAGINDGMSVDERLVLALRRCLPEGGEPDSDSFRRWVSRVSKYLRAVDMTPDTEDLYKVDLSVAVLERLSLVSTTIDAIRSVLVSSKQESGSVELRRQLAGAEAEYELLASALNSASRSKLPSCTEQGKHRRNADGGAINGEATDWSFAFWRACENNNLRECLIALGALRATQKTEDEGRLGYLEATTWLRQENYLEAIKHARKVAPESRWYKKALLTQLEAHAFLGNEEEVFHGVRALGKDSFTPARLSYIRMVHFMNSRDPEPVAAGWTVLLSELGEVALDIYPNDPAYRKFTKYFIPLFVEFAAALRGLGMRVSAYLQVGKQPFRVGTEQEVAWLLDRFGEDARLKKIHHVMGMVPDVASLTADVDKAGDFVVNMLLAAAPKNVLDVEIVYLTLTGLYEIGDFERFVEYVLLCRDVLIRLSRLGGQNSERAKDVVRRAYIKAAGTGSDYLKEIDQLAKVIGIPVASKEEMRVEAKRHKIVASLSALGRIAYQTALATLEAAEKAGHQWHDGGGISLGFFRVLEIEYNERLIKPLVKPEFLQALEHEYKANLQNNIGASRDERDFWKWRCKELREVDGLLQFGQSVDATRANNKFMPRTRSGLELGALERLFEKASRPSGADESISRLVRQQLRKGLTSRGMKALDDKLLANAINKQQRDEYRNPPAHVAILPLNVARDCRRHVEATLECLAEWVSR